MWLVVTHLPLRTSRDGGVQPVPDGGRAVGLTSTTRYHPSPVRSIPALASGRRLPTRASARLLRRRALFFRSGTDQAHAGAVRQAVQAWPPDRSGLSVGGRGCQGGYRDGWPLLLRVLSAMRRSVRVTIGVDGP